MQLIQLMTKAGVTFNNAAALANIAITGLSQDSRTIRPGELFCAVAGTQQHGNIFIDAAIAAGAAAVLIDAATIDIRWRGTVPLLAVPQLSMRLAMLAAYYYDNIAHPVKLIGVTGTSGKTSCSQFIAGSLQSLDVPCGVIGTLGYGFVGALQAGTLTTPDAISLQKMLADLRVQGARSVAMEVSSHALEQGRVAGLQFDIAIFTNLSRDHLDYHGTMQAYAAAKAKLFMQTRASVINIDDAVGREFAHTASGAVYTYGMKRDARPDIYADAVISTAQGMQADVHTPWGRGVMHVPLSGMFNLYNAMAVLASLCLLDIPLEKALARIAVLTPVPGRMQAFGGISGKPRVIVDYAHKPDALEKVLHALRPNCRGQLICVFGCGGERDRGKRPQMAEIATRLADKVIVTDDNPRHEDPAVIVADILAGVLAKTTVSVQHNRLLAIREAIAMADEADCILIAGKGAETYQLVGEQKFPFDDAAVVDKMLKL